MLALANGDAKLMNQGKNAKLMDQNPIQLDDVRTTMTIKMSQIEASSLTSSPRLPGHSTGRGPTQPGHLHCLGHYLPPNRLQSQPGHDPNSPPSTVGESEIRPQLCEVVDQPPIPEVEEQGP